MQGGTNLDSGVDVWEGLDFREAFCYGGDDLADVFLERGGLKVLDELGKRIGIESGSKLFDDGGVLLEGRVEGWGRLE